MSQDSVTSILREYDEERDRLDQFKGEVEALLTKLVAANNIVVHSVTARVKPRDSLEKKVRAEPRRYPSLGDVTDVVGARIITLFEDEVDRAGDVIEREFEVDTESSTDRRQLIDPDRFGYLSLHYIARLSPARRDLVEYRPFANVRAEIQVRSILQHAWAEIYHDLGYKSEEGIPRDFVRGFARIASVLEIADAEFVRLRDGLRQYEEGLGAAISRDSTAVDVDQASLRTFVTTSTEIARLDKRIAEAMGSEVEEPSTATLAGLARAMHYLGLTTISDVERALRASGDDAVRLAVEYMSGKRLLGSTYGGESLSYLADTLALERGSREDYVRFLKEAWGESDEIAKRVALTIVDAYERLSKRQGSM